jgi:UDP-N-acetylglucosamine acyltransferase
MSIHPTAIINPQADLDSSVTVGPFCVIEGHVQVGAGCRLYHNVYLTGWTRIEPDCELHPGVIVGHAPQDIKYKGERSYCRIGRGTILREQVTIHRGTVPESVTVVGEDCFLLAGSHVGHNCTVGNRVTLINNALLGGHVEIGDGVTIGGASGIHQFVRIGELAMVAGAGRAGMDVVPYALTDTEGRIAGLNRVGLRRAGIPREHVADIRNAFRILFSARSPLEHRLGQLTSAVQSPPGRRLLQFVRATSKRGLAGRSRRTAIGLDGDVD